MAIGLGEFNYLLNYSRCTCEKLLAKGLCTLGIVRINASDIKCQLKNKGGGGGGRDCMPILNCS